MTRRTPRLRKVLVAARGEIAVRVIRACDEMGLATVAVASEADATAPHARAAGERVILGPAPARESYLKIDRLVAAAREHGCDAVHPGYGFLSESPSFAEAVARAGLIFVGPPPEAMRLMGDKTAARRAMAAAGVPVLPGFEGEGREDAETLRQEAARLGLPLVVKAAAGGGGKGMRVVRRAGDLDEALASSRREAEAAFGDGRVFLERFVDDARHVEVQVLADARGGFVHLFDRDCSIQRRFQKIVEEAPAPRLDPGLRERMGAAAVAAARACGYVNAGTVEFLLGPDGGFHFLEMNTRIQVEHPVTELIAGVDLVRLQLRVAAGEPLPFRQEDLVPRGCAIECRVNAEDPAAGFAPAAGRILAASWPEGPGIRVDAGVGAGDEVTVHYDPLLLKVIAWAEDRDAAVRRMEAALGRFVLLGVPTNVPLLRAILAHPVYRKGAVTLAFLETVLSSWRPPAEAPAEAFVAAAVFDALSPAGGAAVAPPGAEISSDDPWSRADGWRPGAP